MKFLTKQFFIRNCNKVLKGLFYRSTMIYKINFFIKIIRNKFFDL